jgi:hypothetical protein
MAKLMSLEVNGISVSWDENGRRTLRPCVKCKEPTRGRATNGGGIKYPACTRCAIDVVFDKVFSVFKLKP